MRQTRLPSCSVLAPVDKALVTASRSPSRLSLSTVGNYKSLYTHTSVELESVHGLNSVSHRLLQLD